ncbi:AzlC family ABC transporter permease [Halococcus sp. IIIV-5B]|uniref:AzlC family ABC transporter permease n=1 Tax=Halococcus sp. IIIV-5B TaxID=2321230 RepID=UPI001F27A797|nr:AzlC family ABC transporter permease [Halococcus sp. IIIV-5B]
MVSEVQSIHDTSHARVLDGMSARHDLVAGAKATAPLLLGVLPFGLIVGVTASNVGLSPVEMVGMSVLVFAGAAQLAAIDLMGQGAPVAVVVMTAVVMNVRHTMYSASIAPYFRRLSGPAKWASAYFLNDETYAVAITEFRNSGPDVQHHKRFYLGSGVAMLTTWVVSTALGIVLGANLPAGLSLEFAIPLTYLALLFTTLDDRSTVVAALVAAGVSLVAAVLPFNLSLVAAALVGIAAGVAVEVYRGTFPTVDREPRSDSGADTTKEGSG